MNTGINGGNTIDNMIIVPILLPKSSILFISPCNWLDWIPQKKSRMDDELMEMLHYEPHYGKVSA